MVQLNFNGLSDIADFLTFLRRFAVRLEISRCLAGLASKWRKFSLISNLALTTRITINYSKSKFFFSRQYLNRNRLLSLNLDLQITVSLQYGKFLSIVRLCIVFKSSEVKSYLNMVQQKLIPF